MQALKRALEKDRKRTKHPRKNAYQKLLSNDLAAVPAADSNTATPPEISGLYTGAEGRYKVIFQSQPHNLIMKFCL